MVPITSHGGALGQLRRAQVELKPKKNPFLTHTSYALCYNLMPIQKAKLKPAARQGSLHPDDLTQLENALLVLLGL